MGTREEEKEGGREEGEREREGGREKEGGREGKKGGEGWEGEGREKGIKV